MLPHKKNTKRFNKIFPYLEDKNQLYNLQVIKDNLEGNLLNEDIEILSKIISMK